MDLKIGGAAADQIVVRAEPTTVPVTGGTAQIIASVIDVNGNALVGAPVVFSADQGVLSSNSAVTNGAGEARTSLETTRTTIVRAAVGAKNATVTVTAVALPTISIALASSGGIGGGSGQPEIGLPVSFTVTPGTATTGNPIRNVVVDYGDGQTDNLGGISAGTTVSHTYTRPGTYRVTATVTDIQGLTNSASIVINVSERSPITLTLTATPNPVSISGALQQGLVEFSAQSNGVLGLTYSGTLAMARARLPPAVRPTTDTPRPGTTPCASRHAHRQVRRIGRTNDTSESVSDGRVTTPSIWCRSSTCLRSRSSR